MESIGGVSGEYPGGTQGVSRRYLGGIWVVFGRHPGDIWRYPGVSGEYSGCIRAVSREYVGGVGGGATISPSFNRSPLKVPPATSAQIGGGSSEVAGLGEGFHQLYHICR